MGHIGCQGDKSHGLSNMRPSRNIEKMEVFCIQASLVLSCLPIRNAAIQFPTSSLSYLVSPLLCSLFLPVQTFMSLSNIRLEWETIRYEILWSVMHEAFINLSFSCLLFATLSDWLEEYICNGSAQSWSSSSILQRYHKVVVLFGLACHCCYLKTLKSLRGNLARVSL